MSRGFGVAIELTVSLHPYPGDRFCDRSQAAKLLAGCSIPSEPSANMCSLMIVCVLLPRFQLTVAAGDRTELLRVPAALAPGVGGVQTIGEVSLAAEAFGVHPGMRMGEALARCPRLTLVPPDPAGVADAWERLLVRLESVGASVEPERPGLVCFEAQGMLRLYGGIEGVLGSARRALRSP